MEKQRESRIDLLRGLALLLIFVGHSEFSFSGFVQHSRGFADASDIFVLLAGVSAALAYYRTDGSIQWLRPWKRALTLYLVHILLFSVLAAIAAALMLGDGVTAWTDMISFWHAPSQHGTEALLLTYMPGNLDILPLYVVLLGVVPIVFWLHHRSQMLLLGLSCLVWLASGIGHINLRNWALDDHDWYFDPFSWQFLFIIGIVIGIGLKQSRPVLRYDRLVFIAAAAFAVAAIPINLAVYLGLTGPPLGELYHQLVSKTNSGPLRVLNAVAILYLAWNIRFVLVAANLPAFRLICAAGKHSLPVFSLGVLLVWVAKMLLSTTANTPLSIQIAMLVIGCLLQLTTARCLEERQRKIIQQKDVTATMSLQRGITGGSANNGAWCENVDPSDLASRTRLPKASAITRC
ncbi:OpgC domain-containing protein [Ensifer adhaerens]|uniref:OpgC domain-containing protein n=1 Tax=Ensifer adhaerens TaxID=106592 RepID=UPI001CBEB837|nr:OpgC domain-containing protein [Ensifer adhaerens]MBZ7925728.1 OpgC domain-containing protein [Ensifer adhaerens]UAX95135.1 OpgC domain-containing protein [Ensifer adhaerens]UAY02974.1 OpgC domain-containing protein [Ensifer adhaerens]UAY10958.1 OpgC domain-containing protein [Ensifer adhaerens]